MDTTAITPNVLTAQETQTIIAQPVSIPDWGVPPQSWDILATMVLGILAVWAKETWTHYSNKSTNSTDFTKMVRMIIPGIFAGLLGGEIASATGHEATTWLFALIIGFSGTPAIEMITNAVLAMLEKLLKNLGAEFEKLPKNDTITTYENTHNNTTNSVHDLPNNSVGTIHRPPEPVLATPTTEPAVVPVSTVPDNGIELQICEITKDFDWVDVGESLPEDIKQKAKVYAENTLQPIRTAFGVPLKINSWYRSPAKNARTPGASLTSFHMTAEACDIDVLGGKSNKDLLEFMWANKETLCFDKVIAEHWNGTDYSWIHIQSKPDKQRKEFYIASGSREQPVYTPYHG